MVSFGDSLSDVGAYAPATSLTGNGAAPYFGGKFTTNSGPASAAGTVWVENLATSMGLAVTPHEVGFAGSIRDLPGCRWPAPPWRARAQAMVRAVRESPTPTASASPAGALTVPMKAQIANHLARFGNFKSSDLVLVFGGNNDVLTQFSIFATAAGTAAAQGAAGQLTPTQVTAAQSEAQTVAYVAIQKAALELAGYVKSEIVAKGGTYVAVMNLPDIAQTPFGGTVPTSVRPVLTGLVNEFNLWLRTGLDGAPVMWVDVNAFYKTVNANPSTYGFVNNTVPACDAAKISALTGGLETTGSSLFCNSTPSAPYNGLRAGADVNTWAFADGVHPTTGGHKAISDEARRVLVARGWL